MTIGEKLKEIRKRFGLSQERLAEIINVSRKAITKWENDLGMPDISNLQELSKTFGITVDYFINNQTELPLLVLTKKIEKEKYISNSKNKVKNYINSYSEVLSNYFDSSYQVYSLTKLTKENKLEIVLDILTGGLIYGTIKDLSDLSVYCLAIKGDIKLLVNIKDWTITIKELPTTTNEKKFTLDDKVFRKGALLKLKRKN